MLPRTSYNGEESHSSKPLPAPISAFRTGEAEGKNFSEVEVEDCPSSFLGGFSKRISNSTQARATQQETDKKKIFWKNSVPGKG